MNGRTHRSNEEVVGILLKLYLADYGGKTNQRFTIDREDLRRIYGFNRLFESRVDALRDEAAQMGLLLIDVGQTDTGARLAFIKTKTAATWRKVPRRTVESFEFEPGAISAPDEVEDEGEDA